MLGRDTTLCVLQYAVVCAQLVPNSAFLNHVFHLDPFKGTIITVSTVCMRDPKTCYKSINPERVNGSVPLTSPSNSGIW